MKPAFFMAGIVVGAAFALGAASSAFAADSGIKLGKRNTNAPISVSADSFTGDFKTKVGVYSGNVIVSQGDVKLRANSVKVAVKDGKPDHIEANGHVILDAPGSGTAAGDTGVYDLGPRTVTLNGHVVLTKDKNVMRGTSLVINLDTGEATLAAKGAQGGRVQGLFTPPTKSPSKNPNTKPK